MSSNSTANISKNTSLMNVSAKDCGLKYCLSKEAFLTVLAVSIVFAEALAVVVSCILILHAFSVITLPLWAFIGAVSIALIADGYVLVVGGIFVLAALRMHKDTLRSAKKKIQLSKKIKSMKALNQLNQKQVLEIKIWFECLQNFSNAQYIETRKMQFERKKVVKQVTQSSSKQISYSYDIHKETSLDRKAVSTEKRDKLYQEFKYMINNHPKLLRNPTLKDIKSTHEAGIKHHMETRKLLEQYLKTSYAEIGVY